MLICEFFFFPDSTACWEAIRQLHAIGELTFEDEIFRLPSASSIYLNEAAAFLQRYIWKKGNKNYMASYEFEPPEEEPCVAKLDLIGVTPLKEKVEGQIRETRKDAFKSGRSILSELDVCLQFDNFLLRTLICELFFPASRPQPAWRPSDSCTKSDSWTIISSRSATKKS